MGDAKDRSQNRDGSRELGREPELDDPRILDKVTGLHWARMAK